MAPATQHLVADLLPNVDDADHADEAQLVGVDYDTGIPGKWRVLTHWRLGRQSGAITLLDRDGRALAESRTLAAASNDTPQYQSVNFDIAPLLGLRARAVLSSGVHEWRLPDASPIERYVPFANQMVLIGSHTQRDGDVLRADLQWLSARPLTRDYVVSARVNAGQRFVTHDSVPALGALPTLKWIAGSSVTDRHPLTVGRENGALRGTVVVYDSATQLPLPPLDERYTEGVTFPVEP
jgi:hypothetical protein